MLYSQLKNTVPAGMKPANCDGWYQQEQQAGSMKPFPSHGRGQMAIFGRERNRKAKI
jgi:hypothetical protein